MKRDLKCFNPNSIELRIFCGLYFDFVLSTVIKYKALVGVLSPPFDNVWVLYKGRIFRQPRSKNTLRTCFVLSARTTKFFIFLCFLSWRMQTLQRAPNFWRRNSQISQHGNFVHYPFFVLNIPLFTLLYFTFSYRNFFPLFVCFDILWQLATTHARDNTRTRTRQHTRQLRK